MLTAQTKTIERDWALNVNFRHLRVHITNLPHGVIGSDIKKGIFVGKNKRTLICIALHVISDHFNRQKALKCTESL